MHHFLRPHRNALDLIMATSPKTFQCLRPHVMTPYLSLQIQDLEAENSELKKQLQVLEEQLMIAQVPPVSIACTPHCSIRFCLLAT